MIPQILVCEDGGCHFATRTSISPVALLAVAAPHSVALPFCVKLAAESACFFGCALSGVAIHEIPAGTNGFVRRVALGVKRHERAALFRIAIRASEIILAIGVEHTSFPIVEILRVFDGAIIVDVQFFSPKRRRLRSRDRCGAPRWLSGWYFLPLLPVRVSPPWHSIVCQP